ncbi:hypothetical protein Tco_0288071 [Tanacetum coccineum]
MKRRNRRRSKQRVEPFSLEESPVDTMADQRTMAELLRAPTKGYAEAIVVPPILAEHFELKYSLINMMTSDQFFGLEKDNPHDHIRWFNKITSTINYKDVPNHAIKLMLFPFFLAGWYAFNYTYLSPLKSDLNDPKHTKNILYLYVFTCFVQETDIRQKYKKSSKNGQNRARNGKA